MAAKKRGLGRGLDALLGEAKPASQTSTKADGNNTASTTVASEEQSPLREMPIEFLQRGKYQPRRDMTNEALEELAESIKAQGVMQPLVVRSIGGKKYEIIAGERRWRASQLAGLSEVPVIIKNVSDEAAIAMALIENIQREDLNPIEEAIALQRLQKEFDLTQQEVAKAVGKSRSTVANLLRLMSLKDDVKRLLEHGDLEMGHARCLLALPDDLQSSTATQVVSKGLSVRQTEALVRKLQQTPSQLAKQADSTADVKQLENELSEKIGSPVQLQYNAKGKGKLVISYSNLDELDGVLAHLRR